MSNATTDNASPRCCPHCGRSLPLLALRRGGFLFDRPACADAFLGAPARLYTRPRVVVEIDAFGRRVA